MLTKIESDYFHRRMEECELFWSLKGIVGQHLLKFLFCSWNFPELSLPYITKDNRHRDYLLSTDSSEHLIPPVGGHRKGKEANFKNLFKCQCLNTCGICLPWSSQQSFKRDSFPLWHMCSVWVVQSSKMERVYRNVAFLTNGCKNLSLNIIIYCTYKYVSMHVFIYAWLCLHTQVMYVCIHTLTCCLIIKSCIIFKSRNWQVHF